MNEKVLRYLLSCSLELVLWVALFFCFKHDYTREDFVFIPIEASWVLAVLFALTVKRIITNVLNKWTK